MIQHLKERAMPTDATAAEYRTASAPAELESDRSLPAGAGLAVGIVAGTAIWSGVLALFFLL
jgi:hypothetical protein